MLWFSPAPCSDRSAHSLDCRKCGLWMAHCPFPSRLPGTREPSHPRLCPLPKAIPAPELPVRSVQAVSQALPNKLPAHKSPPVSRGARPKTAPLSSIKEKAEPWVRTYGRVQDWKKEFFSWSEKRKSIQKAPFSTEKIRDHYCNWQSQQSPQNSRVLHRDSVLQHLDTAG